MAPWTFKRGRHCGIQYLARGAKFPLSKRSRERDLAEHCALEDGVLGQRHRPEVGHEKAAPEPGAQRVQPPHRRAHPYDLQTVCTINNGFCQPSQDPVYVCLPFVHGRPVCRQHALIIIADSPRNLCMLTNNAWSATWPCHYHAKATTVDGCAGCGHAVAPSVANMWRTLSVLWQHM